jgi:hypothetical protein
LEAAVRAWAVADYLALLERAVERAKRGRGREEYVDLGPSAWALVFDTETTTDTAQQLRVGCFQARRDGALKDHGLFVDAEALTASELDIVHEYANVHGLRVLSREEFVERVFFRYGFFRRGLVIGFNLPFDISRLATDHGPAKGTDRKMRGGFTFTLSANPRRPHVQIKRAGPSAAFIRFTIPRGRSVEQRNREKGGKAKAQRGYFVDVATPARSLLGRRYTLKDLADTLETDHRKLDSGGHGEPITPEYLDYLTRDVQVTWECFEKLRDRYQQQRLTQTPITRVYSEASIGKALQAELGLQPWRRLQADMPDWLLATIMETYYGGRNECRIRKIPVPGVYVDFLSEYSTVFCLLDLWPYMVSTGINWQQEDPRIVQTLLDTLDVEQVLNPAFWPQLQALALIDPDGARVPTRARYKTARKTSSGLNVALADRAGGVPQLYALPDLVASKLETGRAPRVLKVLRFQPLPEQQDRVRPFALAGDPRYRIDPATDNLIQRLIELRAEVRAEREFAERQGDLAASRRLDGIQQAMKVTASATCYGVPIEMNVTEQRRPVNVNVHLPDGTNYRTRSDRIEEPGRRYHPLIATLVASGGRLLLATAIALVHEHGGEYVFCDTDSLFIAASRDGRLIPCPGGRERTSDRQEAIHTLSWETVKEISERFRSLNPYDTAIIDQSILELEPENLHPKTGKQREILAYSLAAKRYSLFVYDESGRPKIIGKPGKRRRSEHGLGHLQLPRDENGSTEAALDQWWEHTLCLELGIPNPEPDWFGSEAIGRLTVTSPREEKAFKAFNKGLPYREQVRPWNFLNIAHPTRLERAARGITCLVSRFETDPVKQRANPWYDRADRKGHDYRIRTDDSPALDDDKIAVQTFRDYFNDHRQHTDGKMLAADGGPCRPWTRGLLQPAIVTVTSLARVGKESTPLTDDPGFQPDDRSVEYRPRVCAREGCLTTVSGRRKWCSEACRKQSARRQAATTSQGPSVRDR